MLTAIVITICHIAGGCREVVAAQQDIPACIISQAAVADWKEHSFYRGDRWSISRMRCEAAGYQPKDAI
jgi:hypothetical protein